MAATFASLPEHLLPQSFQFLLIFYDVIEQSYCFLTKRKMKCSVGNFQALYNQLVIATALKDQADWQTFQFDRLVQIVMLCSAEFKLLPIGAPSDQLAMELAFKTFAGPGKGHSASRRKCLLEGLWSIVFSHYTSAMGLQEVGKKALAQIRKAGWPAGYEINSCTLPASTPTVAPVKADEPVKTKLRYAAGFKGPYAALLNQLEDLPCYKDQIKHVEYLPAKPAVNGTLDKALPAALQGRIREHSGIERWYQHQAAAINAVRAGQHVIVSTSTASGKSLIYNIPVIEAMMEMTNATAIYLFPTKALAQDQLRCLHDLVGSCSDLRTVPMVCDGDTSTADRVHIQKAVGNVILTNPDMLHHTLLPDHKAWRRLFNNLRYVVIDEAHHYRGAFGAHVSAVFRRLLRVCLYYGNCPQIICCTATVANPLQHICRLLPLQAMCNEDVEGLSEEALCNALNVRVIDASFDGAPTGGRTMVMWNPPLRESSASSGVESNLSEASIMQGSDATAFEPAASEDNKPALSNERCSSIYETAVLLSQFIVCQQRTIAFCRVRKLVELVYKYTQTILTNQHREDLLPLVASYRGGYSKEERRDIEADLFSNRLLAVTATCALELGINIGQLNVTLHMGFPGTFSSLLQQIGRAGRSMQPSLHVIVCFNCPIDQYFVNHPDKLIHSQAESVIVDCENMYILRDHIVCAAKEVPLNYDFVHPSTQRKVSDASIWGKTYLPCLQYLHEHERVFVVKQPEQKGDLEAWRKPDMTKSMFFSAKTDADKISLRMIDPVTITLVNDSTGEVMDSIGYSRAFYELFEGAIYMHRGMQYLVIKLDIHNHFARAKPVHVKYHTNASNRTDINVIKVLDQQQTMNCGIVQVVHSIFGFQKRYLYSNQVFEQGECVLPPLEYETHAFWIDIPLTVKQSILQEQVPVEDAIHAVNHCIVNSMTMFLSCDASDMACEHAVLQPRLLVYDQHMGGTGVSMAMFKHKEKLLALAKEVLQGCPCVSGCPACILDARCSQYNNHLSKRGAILLLDLLINLQQSVCGECSTELTPRKVKRQRSLEHASMDSGRSREMGVQRSWTDSVPNFITESHLT